MNLVNVTKMAAGYAPGRLKDGTACLVLVAKGTFTIPTEPKASPKLVPEQPKPYNSDGYAGDPASSYALFENDYPPFKPFCDVLLHGSAYTKNGEPTECVRVGLVVGTSLRKQFNVIGDRTWSYYIFGCKPSQPSRFTQLPINWERAYGGTDNFDPERMKMYQANPIGTGYWPKTPDAKIEDLPVPNTEEIGNPIQKTTGKYAPQGFGPIGRHWSPRVKYAGTYDQQWQEQRAPYLPDDFDERFYQCAPADQQIPYLQGGETVQLVNLSPHGILQFSLPKVEVPMTVIRLDGYRESLSPVIDTLILEPDKGIFSFVWRTHLPIPFGPKEIKMLLIGKPTPGRERAYMMNKPYVPLSELTRFAKQYQAIMKENEDR
ncbi:MAG: DUF2169 domain-containing protein [Candidatus Parabeggiatoa sp. nov. 3]|nr:MAG: DUF2169 domain-containing protein [Gammaproteobacteria bacterium]RKZ62939.1 MAG: DUF2169 domain-containing protein [Gammaproteobacteria bacterium]RKZ83747.1 MAG: DUF2169 domain-containing protein [Gammaproteobacteria bacterium]HEW98794.1 DUF2169 domain-containing protein [Beggiatoa sp.]